MKTCKKKLLKSGLFCALAVGLCNINFYTPVNAAEYSIASFDELVNNSSAYKSGDLINTIADLTATQNIGDIFSSGGNYTFNGNNHTFDGSGYKGFTINKNTEFTINDFNTISNFNTNGNGGVFENNGTLTINSSGFDSNTANKGGTVFNKGVLNVNNSSFTNNGTTGGTTYGGAIRSEAGTLNITDSTFTNNISMNYGGAIATSNTVINISGSTFENNHTNGRGGVLSSNAYATIRDSIFKNNSSGTYGGALNLNDDVYIDNSIFEGNHVVDGNNRENGGAIRAESGNLLINNSTFKGNSANWGGAVSSSQNVTLSIINSVFDGNSADKVNATTSSGGAITNGYRLTILNSAIINNQAKYNGGGVNFNGSVLNISADGNTLGKGNGFNKGDTIFEGNTLADGSSSGLHVYQGLDTAPVVNLNASKRASVIFNDAIVVGDKDATGSGSIEFNINKEISYNDLAGHVYAVPTEGQIIINNTLGGITESILNLYNGTLKIGENGTFNNVSMNLNGGILETRNGVNDTLEINDFNINKDTFWRMDVDLANGKSDNLNINGNLSQTQGSSLIIETIKLTSDFSESDRVIDKTKEIYFSNKNFGDSPIASLAYDQTILTYVTTNSTYYVSTGYDNNGSKLGFTYKGLGGLPYAVSKDGTRIYSGTGDEKITSWTSGENGNYLKGDRLIIWGNDYSVTNASGKELQGIVVGKDESVNSQTFEIHDVKSWSGFSDSYKTQRDNGKWDVYGGAFAVLGERSSSIGTLNVENVNFEKNYVGTLDNPNDYSYGGAISIAMSSSTAFANISDSKFTKNSVVGNDAYGGAISVTLGNLSISNSSFNSNTTSSTGLHAYGGAIYLTHKGSKLNIDNSGFSGNSVSSFTSGGGYQQANGGAISTVQNETTSYISNSAFVSNHADGYKANGGAINNAGTMTIADSYFRYNYASSTGTAQGGAISNSGNLTIIALTDNPSFSGNFVEKVKKNKDGTFTRISKESQALYNTSTVNMNAAEEQSILFYDKIDGSNGTLNINKSNITYTDFKNTETAPVKGNVIINNTIKNHTINLYNGTLSIGKDTSSLASGDKYFENVSLNGYGGTFDTQNGQIDNNTLVNLSFKGNTHFALDVDLAAKTSDYLTVNGNISGSGNLVIDAIKVLTDMKAGVNTVDTRFINKNISNAIVSDVAKTVSTNDYIYMVSLIDNNTTLRFEKASASLGLPEAVAKPDITEFDMTREELVGEWLSPTLNDMQGDLTIVGNRHSIIAENHLEGIKTNGYTLNLIEVGDLYSDVLDASMRNFDSALINTNNGTINSTHSVYTNNVALNSFVDIEGPPITGSDGEDITTSFVGGNGAAIENLSGTVNINGGIFYGNKAENLGGAIYNNGKLNLIASEGNRVIFENNSAMTVETLNAYANDIYQTADGTTMVDGSGGMVYFGGGFAGEGSIIKDGVNEMVLGATSSSSKYTGEFILAHGTLTVKNGAEFFGGKSEVTDGILNWDTKEKLVDGAQLAINGGSVNVLSNGQMFLDDKTRIRFIRNAHISIQDGGILENQTQNLIINGGQIQGYNDGNETTYGTFKNTGTLTLLDDNSTFKGMYLQTEGNTILEKDSIMFSNTDLQGGTVTFFDNATINTDSTFTSANSDGEKTIFLNNSTNSSSILGVVAESLNKNLKIIISNTTDTVQTTKLDQLALNDNIVSLTIRDNVIYDGNIDIGSNAELNLEVNDYDMKFNNNIIDINDSSKFQISTQNGHSITIDGNSIISGNADIGDGGIIKDGTGTLVFNGDASQYTGNFTQYEGKTVVSTNGFIFSGIKNILSGELEISSNTGMYYKDVNLGNNTTLTHKSSIPTGGNITTDTFAFTGSNASAIFTAIDGMTTNAKYDIQANIQNENTNTISFENSKVTLGITDFTGNTVYNFDNSRIDLHSSNSEMKDYVFSHLNSDNTALDIKLSFVNDAGTIKLSTDTLTVENSDIAGGNIFELGNITIHDASLENGSLIYNTVSDVLQGEASFKDQPASNIVAEGATTIYEYELSLTDTKKSIQLKGLGAADENSLNKINVKDINRFFNFSKGTSETPEYYYNAKSLDPTGMGNFVVSGATENAADSILSGKLISGYTGEDKDKKPIFTGQEGSLFNMAEETQFTLQNLTVENTYKDGAGSVISIGTPDKANTLATAEVENVIIQNAHSTGDGGAIYNNGGIFNIDNSKFYNNISDSMGGVIKNETGTVSIFNVNFGDTDNKGNEAQSGGVIATGIGSSTDISYSQFNYNTANQDGGAIYNLGDLTLTESNVFSNNTASNGRGGAIYNDGNLVISSKTLSDTVLKDNNDSKGLNDIYQSGNGKIIINGDGGKVAIMSGIAGEGTIIKEGINELILGSSSINTNFEGNFILKEGTTTLNGEFFGGQNNITGGILNWNTVNDKISSSVLIADGGTLNINGKLSLNNSSDALNKDAVININSNSLLAVENGYLSLDRNGNEGDFANYDKWNGVITQSGGKIDYNIDTNGIIQAAGGEFNILGGNFTLKDVQLNDVTYTSVISENVALNIANNSTLTLDSKNANLVLNTGDNWNSDATVNIKNGTLIYTDNIGNGKLIAESGTLNIIGSNLVLNSDTDLIKNTLSLNLDDKSSLEVNAGNVTLNSNDELHGIIMLNKTGNIVADGVSRSNKNIGVKYQQNGGHLLVSNNSDISVYSPDSFFKSGDVKVDNSKLIIGNTVSDLNITNLTLENNAFFNTYKELTVTNNLNMNNSYLSTINNVIRDNSLENLIVSSGSSANFAIDINGREKISDKFLIGNIETDAYDSGLVNINNFNFTGAAPMEREITLQVFDSQNISNKIVFDASGNPVMTPIGNYKLFSQGGGFYNLKLMDYNPQAYRGQVATMAAYQNQLMVDNIVLDHIMLVSQEVIASDNQNKYAATLPQFAPYQYSQKDGGVWVKNYVNFETLDMTQNLNVGNNSYGTLVGVDLPLVKLKKGWKFIPTAYIGYNGGHQYFNNVSMYQNGGQGGFMGTFLKDDFIGSVMAYGGGYGNEMSVAGYTDNTGNWFAGTATKLAYNFHPSKNIIIQPTAFASYNIFGSQNWNSQYGALSMNSGLLNGINVAPGLNIIYGRENWSLYATFQYMYNINDNISGQAGNVNLPSIKMEHGYIEYGIGATKKWKDRFNAYGQVTLRNGGRTGIGFQLGAQYAFDIDELLNLGKRQKNESSPALYNKKVIKSLK